MSPFEHRLSLLSLSQNPTTHWEVSKANIHPRKKYTFQTSEMAPKRKQTTKSSGTVTGTISTKPADKEEQAKARALKRAERVEARRAEAEKRKEAVRPLLCHLCHQPRAVATDSDARRDKDVSRSRFRETLTSARANFTKPSRNTSLLSKSMAPVFCVCQTWPQRGLN